MRSEQTFSRLATDLAVVKVIRILLEVAAASPPSAAFLAGGKPDIVLGPGLVRLGGPH